MGKKHGKILAALLLASMAFVLGCIQTSGTQADSAAPDSGGAMQGGPAADGSDGGAMPGAATQNSSYVPFSQAAYEQAKAGGKIIFLEFYANWCPTCAQQKPVLESTFQELDGGKVIAFQVNYNDSDTDDSERALAKKFGITYQHTHIITNASEEVLLRGVGQWSREEIIKNTGSVN
ncbi:MAG: thioredoxin family protein [Candidatus Diapherotrites archaeon]|nr:thioredoxin family protein [Candidatus Diapherotrites archaeon]